MFGFGVFLQLMTRLKAAFRRVCGRREAVVAPHQSSLQHVHALGGKPGARQA